ncbi:hypothetical protein [uncultured Phenylobacterium sp.]|uniref:GFA family protein n=1 Tax=uncultured Phenylobacterium sp. TaxID=349273 RepID=UPI0025EC5D1A|nr:hypothetical protein [uncultured Phenylobacterium sp.]
MIKSACHCGAVRFEVAAAPKWVLDCSCTVCRRYGGLWTYCRGEDPMTLLSEPDPAATVVYSWLDHEIGMHHCRTCGCVTHLQALDHETQPIFGLNARMMIGLDGANITIRRIDNGHLGWFWTRPDLPIIPGHHPNTPPPGREEDWGLS